MSDVILEWLKEEKIIYKLLNDAEDSKFLTEEHNDRLRKLAYYGLGTVEELIRAREREIEKVK